jgi:hypothetical protein
MLSLNISVGIKVCGRTKKLWVEESLTAIYQQTGNIPRVGFKLKTGDVVIGKGSDDKSIILFINNNKKSKK